LGTNFYIRGHQSDDDPQYHIGKRSAAGLYCWDCRKTLCKGGVDSIHSGHSEWHETCPKCGQSPKDEKWNSSAGRELGFNKTKPKSKKNVRSCSSFGWGMKLETLKELIKTEALNCPVCDRPFEDRQKVIVDEYGSLYTYDEFMEVLEECPIHYHDYIGTYFS